MNFKDLLSLGMDDILDMTEERRMQRSRKHMEEFTADSSEDGFYFEDFGGDTSLFEKFEKKEDNQEGFNLMEYGLPIVNAHHGFSYNEAYFIPYERYQEVFDSSFTIHIYFQSALQGWGGNCFGMSVVSILSYLGKISLGDYQKAEVPLPDTAYDHIISEDFGTYCCLEKDSELTKLIERYFVLQFSTSVVDLRLKSISFCENEPERMQRYLNSVRQEKIPYMLSVHWYNDEDNPAGHALVVDSAREPQNLGNGWHRIYLYDPNNPYHRFSNESPAPYYNQAGNRYIDINVITGDWHMSAIVNANPDSKSSLIGSDVEGSNASMYFVDCGSIQGDFTKKSDIHPIHLMGTQMLQYRNDFMSVYDVKGNRLCSVINGALKDCIDERIKNLPVIEAAVAGAHRECAGTLVLPDEPVVIKLKRGFIGLFSPDTYRGCVSEEAVTLCFKEEGCMEVSADFPTVVNVVMNIGEFNTRNVTDMNGMFFCCSNIKELNVSSFNTGNVTDMHGMFGGCKSLNTIDVSRFNTRNVMDMGYMFCGCSSLKTVDVSGFETGNVTDMGSMFEDCKSLDLIDVSKFETGNVTNMMSMFSHCERLKMIDVGGFDTGNVTNMQSMFSWCSSLRVIDVSRFKTGKTETMKHMFYECGNLESINVSGFNTGNVTHMDYMFRNCHGLRVIDISHFNMDKVINKSNMFKGCSAQVIE